VNISAFQLGKDFYRLKRLLSKFPLYKNSTIVGPDINAVGNCQDKVRMYNLDNFSVLLKSSRTFFQTSSDICPAFKFLQQFFLGSKNSLDAVTWHHYYFDGQTANKASFLNPNLFRQLEHQVFLH